MGCISMSIAIFVTPYCAIAGPNCNYSIVWNIQCILDIEQPCFSRLLTKNTLARLQGRHTVCLLRVHNLNNIIDWTAIYQECIILMGY